MARKDFRIVRDKFARDNSNHARMMLPRNYYHRRLFLILPLNLVRFDRYL